MSEMTVVEKATKATRTIKEITIEAGHRIDTIGNIWKGKGLVDKNCVYWKMFMTDEHAFIVGADDKGTIGRNFSELFIPPSFLVDMGIFNRTMAGDAMKHMLTTLTINGVLEEDSEVRWFVPKLSEEMEAVQVVRYSILRKMR